MLLPSTHFILHEWATHCTWNPCSFSFPLMLSETNSTRVITSVTLLLSYMGRCVHVVFLSNNKRDIYFLPTLPFSFYLSYKVWCERFPPRIITFPNISSTKMFKYVCLNPEITVSRWYKVCMHTKTKTCTDMWKGFSHKCFVRLLLLETWMKSHVLTEP